jgi:hypothetical protein
MVVGVFLPYRSGYSGVGYVDGTDDARIFFGAYTLLFGIAIVILAITGSRDPTRATSRGRPA